MGRHSKEEQADDENQDQGFIERMRKKYLQDAQDSPDDANKELEHVLKELENSETNDNAKWEEPFKVQKSLPKVQNVQSETLKVTKKA